MKLKERVELLNKYDKAYRYEGDPIISDKEYDDFREALLNDLPDDHPLHTQIGLLPDERMSALPAKMYSMNKVKDWEAFKKWVESLPSKLILYKGEIKCIWDTEVVLTPKYDGISIVQNEGPLKEAWTRGDGVIGQTSDLYMVATGKNSNLVNLYFSAGEAIIKKDTFNSKWLGTKEEGKYSNGRNCVAGVFNSKTVNYKILPDVEYVRYSLYEDKIVLNYSKEEELNELNTINTIKVPYIKCKIKDITIEGITKLYKKWSKDFEIDGIIIDINDFELRKELGRETNNNPAYARALKFDFEESGDSKMESIDWQVSKNGDIYPTSNITPTDLEGTIVKRASLYNTGRMIEEGVLKWTHNEDGVGTAEVRLCKVSIIKSGAVIPKVTKFHASDDDEIEELTACPECGGDLTMDDNGIHLRCENINCRGRKLKTILGFFEAAKIKNIKEGVLNKLYDAGYEDLTSILNMREEDVLKISGLGKSMATKLSSLAKSLREVGLPLQVLMHASNKFPGLGSTTLKLIIDKVDDPFNVTKEELLDINGIGPESADTYIDGMEDFLDWKDNTSIYFYVEVPEVPESNVLSSYNVCFSGGEDKVLIAQIKKLGGKVSKKMTNKVTHLIVKSKSSTTSKVTAAKASGALILTKEEFNTKLEDNDSSN